MAVVCNYFGETKNKEHVLSFTLSNKSGAYVRILNLGGIIQSLCVPDRDGKLVDVVLGFDTIPEYESDPEYLGVLVGRVANRISKSRFSLNGKEYTLVPMEFDNNLHGGVNGYSFRIWDHKIEEDKLMLSLYSPDMDEGFPGGLQVYVTYSFSDDCKLRIDYRAVAEADTIVNLTNHVYFNLDGGGDIKKQILQIAADSFTEINDHFLVTGNILPVDNTPFDFRQPKEIGTDLESDCEQIKFGLGYDHNFVLSRGEDCAFAKSPMTGITLRLSTDCPGLQLYSGNSLPERPGKGQTITSKFSGFCLETQYYPDSPNHPNFPSIVVREGEEWKHYAEFAFGNI